MTNRDPLTVQVFLDQLIRTTGIHKWRAFYEGNRIYLRHICDSTNELVWWTPLTAVLYELTSEKFGSDEEERRLAVQRYFPITPLHEIIEIICAEDGLTGVSGYQPRLRECIEKILGLYEPCIM